MTIKELKEIASHAARGTAPANFSHESVDAAFMAGLQELAKDYNTFQRNKYDIYDIVIENVDDIMPKRVIDALGAFAEIRVVPQGQTAIFTQRVGRNRAKKFLTQVGLSGVYETFRLDSNTFPVHAHAVGGGATVDFERMLDGSESLAEVMEIITEGLIDAVFLEVQKALKASFNDSSRPAANVKTADSWDAKKMIELISVVRAYGANATIFATPEFVAAMGADAVVPGEIIKNGDNIVGGYGGIYAPDDIDAIHRTGYISLFRGAPVVQIPQSFVDETNTTVWIDPQFAYVLPTGGEKVVKVVLEGATQIRDFENRDNSLEVYAWKKMGAAILTNHNWGIYQNTELTTPVADPYDF